ncbi:ABC transporter permease [Amycolatopsis sp. 195334CR]|uniref:ABC transporter permease n=1 Tax=Amycolatopsis sp. 195334CR TaxID=2814588 RepID=UPI001A8C7B18|nr:FtsX-like permease family protein [Amycolatopsis sp. 195334CR]MBN6040977.1 FtsX-like permease family protein [Amycolatopsis sp. 195334CR]
MIRSALRDLLSHKGRLVATLCAIALGVAATVAGWVLADSITATLAERPVRDGTGAWVSAGTGPSLTEADRGRLANAPGVVAAAGVRVGHAGLVGADGKLVRTETAPDRAGTNWDDTGRFRLTAGTAPGAGEVVLHRPDAEQAGLAPGEGVRVLLGEGRSEQVRVAGLFDYLTMGPDSGDAAEVVPSVAYPEAAAESRFGARYHRIELALAPGAGVPPVAAGLVSSGAELAAAARADIESSRTDLRLTVLPLAAIALLAGMFVIGNTFTVLITQRTRQLALLRAVGATRRQVRRTVVIEAAVLGLAGGTLGCLLGAGLGPVVLALVRPGEEVLYRVSPLAIGLGYLVAVGVTVLAAVGPARRASKVTPMAALRTDPVLRGRAFAGRTVAGLVLLAAAVTGVALTADPSAENLPRIIGLVSAAAGTGGLLLLTPALAALFFRRFRRGSPATRLGVRNAARDPRRTAGSAAAITVGLGLVCAFGTLSATLTELIASTIRANVPVTTTVLRPAAGGDAVLGPGDLTRLSEVPGVTAVAGSRDRIADISYSGGQTRRNISAIEPSALTSVLSPKITAGDADLTRGVVVSRNQADMLGLGVGDRITLSPGPGTSIATRVTGVYEATELQASIYYDLALAPPEVGERVSLGYATGSDPTAVRRSIEAAFADRPDVLVTDQDGLAAQGIESQRLAFVLLYAMFGVAVVIAVFGVVNTLALSVLERTREIGMMRAIGASRSLIRRMVQAESIAISLFGAVLGVVAGLGAGAVMQHAMLGQSLGDASIPLGVIGVCLVGMVLAAVLAALWPARRAAKTEVLPAIAP